MTAKNRKDQSLQIKELEAKIRILEEENASLTDEAESTLLLSLISESLERFSNDIPTLLENALERIAVLKNLPLCCCVSWKENKIGIVSSYFKLNDELNARVEIKIDKKIEQEIEAGSCVFDLRKSKKIKLKMSDDRNEYVPSHLLLIPFKTKFIPNGFFIFADNNSSDRLTGMTFVLQHMVNMICERMDKLVLQNDLIDMNRTLERRVEERTIELIEANDKLKIQIAEKTTTEEALHESETKFRSIAEQLSDVLFLTDTSGIIIYISTSAEKIFQWTPGEMTGKIFTSFLFESEIPKAFVAFSAAVKEKIDTRDLVLLMKRKDGSSFYGELDATVWKLDSGYGTLGVIRDITNRKLAEDETILANLELTTLNRIISESVHQLDSKKLLETALNEALKISGLESGAVFIASPDKSLKLAVAKNLSEGVRSELNGGSLIISEHLCGSCFHEQKPLILSSRQEVISYSSRKDPFPDPVNFHAAFPILAKESAIGVLCVFTYTDTKPTSRSLKLIESMTAQISLSLENANLYERLRQNLIDLELEITERREAEEALRSSEYFFKESQRAAFIGSYNCDFVEGVWESSEVLDQIFGIDKNFRRDIPGWLDIVHPDDRDMMNHHLADEVIGNHKSFDKEYRIIRQSDGEIRWVYGRGTVTVGRDGTVVSMIGTIQDTTERVRGEETLAKLKKAVDASGEAIFMTDVHGIFTYINPAFTSLYGFTAEEIIGKTTPRVIKSGMLDQNVYVQFWETLKSYDEIRGEIVNKRKDGKLINVEGSASPIIDDENNIIGFLGIQHDITDKKLADDALKKSEAKNSALLNAIPDIMFIQNSEGVYLDYHAPQNEMLFASPEIFIGKSMFEILPPELSNEFSEVLKKAVQTKKLQFYEYSLPMKGVTKYYECRVIAYEENRILSIIRDITERKNAESALRESEEIFTQFMKHSPVYLFFKDDQIRSLRLSDNYEKMLGRPLNELIGKNMYDLFPSELARKIVEDDMRILKNGVEVNIDEEFNGRHYTTIKFPIHVEGKPAFLAGFTIDVTERKKAEAEINMLANALKSVDESVTITDMNDNLLFANQSFLKTYGYTHEDLKGKQMSLLRSENNPPEITERILPSTLAGGWSGELINVRKDGTEFPVYLSTSLINDKDGRPVGLIGIARDITERKNFEQEIISQRNKLEQLIINSPVAIAHIDKENKILDVNSSFGRLFGYTVSESVNRDLKIFLLPSGLQPGSEELSAGGQKEIPSGAEGYRRKKDGTLVFVEIVEIPIEINDQIIGRYVMYLDLTHRMQAEKEAIRSKEVAEQSDKMKSEFLAQMSHEIRTPINIIVSNISFIKEQMEDKLDSDDEECFESINLATQRIIRTIELILNMSELQTGAYKSVFRKLDLDSQILQYLYNEFQRTAKMKGIELHYRNETGESEIHADEYSVLQIFANLVDNAIKYTNVGKVEIVLGRHHTNAIKVEIKDSGIGIGDDFIPHLFEPFTQEEQGYTRAYEGNGLGLSLVKRYCELNKATIEVESKKNSGSTFRVIFPINLKAIPIR